MWRPALPPPRRLLPRCLPCHAQRCRRNALRHSLAMTAMATRPRWAPFCSRGTPARPHAHRVLRMCTRGVHACSAPWQRRCGATSHAHARMRHALIAAVAAPRCACSVAPLHCTGLLLHAQAGRRHEPAAAQTAQGGERPDGNRGRARHGASPGMQWGRACINAPRCVPTWLRVDTVQHAVSCHKRTHMLTAMRTAQHNHLLPATAPCLPACRANAPFRAQGAHFGPGDFKVLLARGSPTRATCKLIDYQRLPGARGVCVARHACMRALHLLHASCKLVRVACMLLCQRPAHATQY